MELQLGQFEYHRVSLRRRRRGERVITGVGETIERESFEEQEEGRKRTVGGEERFRAVKGFKERGGNEAHDQPHQCLPHYSSALEVKASPSF